MKKLFSYLKFIFGKRPFIIYGLIVFVMMWAFVDYTNDAPLDIAKPSQWEDLNWWAKWADPIVGMGTFLLALLIGALQLREDWEENLPNRLTVVFKYQDRKVMVCKKAHLTAEGDIRQLGQQIGAQMAKEHLKFRANDIESKPLGVRENEFQSGQFFVHYQVEFELTDLPSKLEFQTANLIWHEPDNTSLENKEEWVSIIVETNDEN